MARPIRALELHYPMIQFLIKQHIQFYLFCVLNRISFWGGGEGGVVHLQCTVYICGTNNFIEC